MASEVEGLIKWAKCLGYTLEHTTKRHLKFISPKGYAVYGSGTPSDRRAIDNIKGKLRRQLAVEAASNEVEEGAVVMPGPPRDPKPGDGRPGPNTGPGGSGSSGPRNPRGPGKSDG